MAKQTTITVETSSLLILQGRISLRAWCPQCAAEEDMIAMANTGAISNLDRRALEQWLTSGELHRTNAPDGSSLICLNSLLACLQNTNPANYSITRLPNTEKEKK
ncbi:MAG: hypothetical protein JO108_18135 [Acidobacteriaceae bacterium]|nr:hypothetical protein [Acidobacteriaceae bacterium]